MTDYIALADEAATWVPADGPNSFMQSVLQRLEQAVRELVSRNDKLEVAGATAIMRLVGERDEARADSTKFDQFNRESQAHLREAKAEVEKLRKIVFLFSTATVDAHRVWDHSEGCKPCDARRELNALGYSAHALKPSQSPEGDQPGQAHGCAEGSEDEDSAG